MATGFRVRYRSQDSAIQGERVLFSLPIRIGRNALNHCQIAHGFISDFHAAIEFVGGQLSVRDLNSKNGICSTAGEPFPPNVPVPLARANNAFILGRLLHVQVEVFEENRPVGERASELSGSVLGNRYALQAGGTPWPAPGGGQGAPPPQGAVDPRVQVAALPPLSGDGRSMMGQPPQGGQLAPVAPRGWGAPNAGPNAESQGLPALAPLPQGFDPYARGGQRDPAQAQPAGPVNRSTQHLSMNLETMALLGLQELAASLVPGVPVQTTGDVARLLTKLHDTVEVFCRCFVPMREGYAQFVSQMDLRQAASQRSLNRSASAIRVEVARDPAAVAGALLDWRNQDYDGPDVIEGIFAELMSHQLALLEGVMKGVQALLEELAPDRIERLLDEDRPPGVSTMLGRYRALWKTFQIHYEALKNESRTFELVFGSSFAASYREYLSRRERTTP